MIDMVAGGKVSGRRDGFLDRLIMLSYVLQDKLTVHDIILSDIKAYLKLLLDVSCICVVRMFEVLWFLLMVMSSVTLLLVSMLFIILLQIFIGIIEVIIILAGDRKNG